MQQQLLEAGTAGLVLEWFGISFCIYPIGVN